MVVKDVDSVMTCGAKNAKRWQTFCPYSTMQHWAFQSIALLPFPNQNRPFLPPEFLNFLLTLIDQLVQLYNYMNYFCTFIYTYIFLIFFFTKLQYLHHSQYNSQFTTQAYIYELYWEWVMQHTSQTILKDNKEVVNLILPKTSKNMVLSGILWKVPTSREASSNYSWFNIDLPKADTSNYSLESF